MITLLMVLFIVLYSISQVDLAKFRRLKQGIAGGFGGPTALAAVQGGAGPLQGGGAVFDAQVTGSGTQPSAEALEGVLTDIRARTAGARKQRSVLQGAQQELQKSLDANRRVELVVLAAVAAALNDIASGNDPPIGEVNPTEGK